MEETRLGGWIQTSTGNKFYPFDPKPEDIIVDDIANALSNLCRYGGHCKRFYSVAEHCVLLAQHAPKEHQLAALFHNASSAYLGGNIPSEVERMLPDYERAEARLMRAIATRYEFDWPCKEVEELNQRLRVDEVTQNMDEQGREWLPSNVLPLGARLVFWLPVRASFEFSMAYFRYRKARV